MAASQEFEKEFEGESIFVSHGKDADDVIAAVEIFSYNVVGKVVVAPHGPVGNHHAFGMPRGAAGVVDEGELVGIAVNVVIDMLLAEVFGVFLPKHLIEVLAGISELVGA